MIYKLTQATSLDGFVLNVGYPKLDWVSTTLSHLYGYADYLAGQGSNFRLVLSLDLYATGAWCYDHSLGDDCGGVCVTYFICTRLSFMLTWPLSLKNTPIS